MPQSTDVISIPSSVPTGFMIFCRFAGEPPSTAEIFQEAQRWAMQNIAPPLILIIAYLDPEMITVRVAPHRDTPAQILRDCAPALSEEQRREIDGATHCITVHTSELLPSERLGLWAAVAMAKACAERYGARVVLDADTAAPFPLKTPFRDLSSKFDPRLASFVRPVYSFGASGAAYMTTRGMARFGLPDLQIINIPVINMDALGATVIGLCQVLITMVRNADGGSEPPAAPIPLVLETAVTEAYMRLARVRGKDESTANEDAEARVRLEYGPRPGHPDQQYFTLRPPANYTGEYGAWLHSLVNTFFEPENTVRPLTLDNVDGVETMDQAHRRALAELPAMKLRFLSGAFAPGQFCVKQGFSFGNPHSDGLEYMWVLVRDWMGNRIVGELVNAPQSCKNVQMGQIIELADAEVFDWIVIGPDGPEEGGYTNNAVEESEVHPSRQFAREIADETTPDFVRRRSDPAFRERVEAAGREAIRRQYEAFLQGFPGGRMLLWGKVLLSAVIGAIFWKWSHVAAMAVLAFSGWQVYCAIQTERRAQQIAGIYKDVSERGEFAVAMPIMVNKLLRVAGTQDAPGLFILAPNDDSDPIMIYDAVARAVSSRDQEWADAESQTARKRLADQRFIPRRRTLIPKAWVDGKTVHAVDLYVKRAHLAGGVMVTGFLPCLATPGDDGSVATISWEIATNLAER
ncbi:MAG: DUF2314 domain-containing protein [Capsulimonas sp.]|uniref:DUF2314 domain-containing protein n=1 Tax=Capsulimonas sp. TaxID=2494211 RepID=UPI003264E756